MRHHKDSWKNISVYLNGYKLSIPFYSKKIKSEPFKNRLIISIFNFLSKIGLVSIFTKIYCKGK